MMAAPLATIDWNAPWLAPYCALGQALAASANWREEMSRLAAQKSVQNYQGKPIRFIPQEDLPAGVPYEAHIGSTGQIPTRDNLHDFFNGLVWLHFPLTKARLNQLQFEQLQTDSRSGEGQYRVGNTRGRLRDATTVFDENGALLLCARPDLAEALREHQWTQVFVERRTEFLASCSFILFGHALMEKLVAPYSSITAHWIDVPMPAGGSDCEPALPDLAAAPLFTAELNNSRYSPLPIFGIPGWWPNQNREFYSNTDIFRPKRVPRA
jgi:hypothetical protein